MRKCLELLKSLKINKLLKNEFFNLLLKLKNQLKKEDIKIQFLINIYFYLISKFLNLNKG